MRRRSSPPRRALTALTLAAAESVKTQPAWLHNATVTCTQDALANSTTGPGG